MASYMKPSYGTFNVHNSPQQTSSKINENPDYFIEQVNNIIVYADYHSLIT